MSGPFGSACGYDYLPYAWTTRYLYDVSGNVGGTFTQDQPVSLASVSETIYGHGNLYATEEYLPAATTLTLTSCPTTGSFILERATNFDDLDRPTAQNEIAFGTAPKQTTTYDTNGYYGLASLITNANGQSTTPSYTSVGAKSSSRLQTTRRARRIGPSRTIPMGARRVLVPRSGPHSTITTPTAE